jgi:hypothetical protein
MRNGRPVFNLTPAEVRASTDTAMRLASANKRLVELHRTAQLALEHHRAEQDDDSQASLDAERALLNAEWLRHTTR